MCKYRDNELINIKVLKNQFRNSAKNYCLFEENKLLFKVKAKHTEIKTNKLFCLDDFYFVSKLKELNNFFFL